MSERIEPNLLFKRGPVLFEREWVSGIYVHTMKDGRPSVSLYLTPKGMLALNDIETGERPPRPSTPEYLEEELERARQDATEARRQAAILEGERDALMEEVLDYQSEVEQLQGDLATAKSKAGFARGGIVGLDPADLNGKVITYSKADIEAITKMYEKSIVSKPVMSESLMKELNMYDPFGSGDGGFS